MRDVKEIVVTGGPCAGKTEGLTYLAEELGRRGIHAFIAPEIATEVIISGNLNLPKLRKSDPRAYYEIERHILIRQIQQRKEYRDLARIFTPDQQKVILFDRGPMECLAYVPQRFFNAILEDERLTLFEARDSYDAVIHLVSAADGAESFYTLKNNKARSENIKKARILDQKTLRAWIGHPHLRAIDNSTDFEGKKERLLREILKALADPPLEIERRFLLTRAPSFRDSQLGVMRFRIEQTYCLDVLENPFRIRKRTRGSYSHYTKTIKETISPGVRSEVEESIGAIDYLNFAELKNPKTKIVRKVRYYFVYKAQYFELDLFFQPAQGLAILEIELTAKEDPMVLPPFLEIAKEITDDPDYSNFAIASMRTRF